MACINLGTKKDCRHIEHSSKIWTEAAAKREMWLRVLNDPMQPTYLRGWVRQELNRLERIRVARREGKPYTTAEGKEHIGPGGSKSRMKTHPSYDAGHKTPGVHDPDNLHPENRDMNRARPGLTKCNPKRR
jgi:hypothetical protein